MDHLSKRQWQLGCGLFGGRGVRPALRMVSARRDVDFLCDLRHQIVRVWIVRPGFQGDFQTPKISGTEGCAKCPVSPAGVTCRLDVTRSSVCD